MSASPVGLSMSIKQRLEATMKDKLKIALVSVVWYVAVALAVGLYVWVTFEPWTRYVVTNISQ